MVAVCQRVHPVAGRSALISRWIARHRLQRRMARIGLGDDPVQGDRLRGRGATRQQQPGGDIDASRSSLRTV